MDCPNKGLIQHARSVVTTDPNAERAMLELIGDPLRPLHRLVGKQSVGEKVEPPNLMDEAKRAGPDSESAAGRLGVEGEVPGSVPAARGDGEESQYEPSIYMGEDHGERMEEVEDVQPEDIWGDDPDPGEPSALRALHGDGEPLGVPTNLVGGSPGAFQPQTQFQPRTTQVQHCGRAHQGLLLPHLGQLQR